MKSGRYKGMVAVGRAGLRVRPVWLLPHTSRYLDYVGLITGMIMDQVGSLATPDGLLGSPEGPFALLFLSGPLLLLRAHDSLEGPLAS